jgi:hypothetical protein
MNANSESVREPVNTIKGKFVFIRVH